MCLLVGLCEMYSKRKKRIVEIIPIGVCPAGFNLGMPPAKRAPNCGGPPPPGTGAEATPVLVTPPPPPPPLDFEPSTMGALLSLVSVFFSFLPC